MKIASRLLLATIALGANVARFPAGYLQPLGKVAGSRDWIAGSAADCSWLGDSSGAHAARAAARISFFRATEPSPAIRSRIVR